jgi:lipopolysaccharide export LptBFGC system permease protein LptF
MTKRIIAVLAILAAIVAGGSLATIISITNQNVEKITKNSKTEQSTAGTQQISSEQSKTGTVSGTYDEADQTTTYDKQQATIVTLADQKTKIKGREPPYQAM